MSYLLSKYPRKSNMNCKRKIEPDNKKLSSAKKGNLKIQNQHNNHSS